ncbi:MAG TPA: hypothetical protein DEP35_10635 [Deltaproteobacteria bacterium]|nr:hypothetical protein [Deltaproteobacteria bacterium]
MARGHHGVEGGRCKVQTLERRLAQLGLDVADRLVCETGFRVAACLTALQARGATVLGLDPNAEGAAPQAR